MSPCCGCWSFPVFGLLELKHTFPSPTFAVHYVAFDSCACCLSDSCHSWIRRTQELFASVTYSSVQCLLPLKFSFPLEHCICDGFRPCGHSLHAVVLSFVQGFSSVWFNVYWCALTTWWCCLLFVLSETKTRLLRAPSQHSICVTIHLSPMFLLENYSIRVVPLLSPTRTAFRDLAVLSSTHS